MRHLYRFVLMLAIVLMAACESESSPLPTRFPTATATLSPTPTSTSTPTPRPTNTPQFRLQTRATNPQDQSYLRLIHAIPDLPPVSVYVNSLALAYELGYSRYSEPTEILAGDYTVSIAVGGINDEDSRPVVQQPLTVEAGQTLFLILAGTVETPILGAYSQDETPLASGESRVALIHAIPHGPVVRFEANGQDIADGVAFGQAPFTDALPSEPTTFAVSSGEQTLVSHVTDLREHFNYTFVALGNPEDSSTFILLEFSNRVPGFATMRAINAMTEVSAVDFYANGFFLEGPVEYTRSTERRQIPTGFYNIKVFEAGADQSASDPLASTEFHLNAGDNISLVSMGSVGNSRLVRFEDDLSAVAPDQVRVVFVNTLDFPPRVRVIEGETSVPDLPDLRPQHVSDPVLLDAGTRDIHWRIVEGSGRLGDSVEVAPNVELSPGRSYLFLMTGRGSDAPPIIFSEVIEIDEALTISEEVTPPPPSEPVKIRVANTLVEDTPVDFLVDGITIAASLGYGQITAPIFVPEGVHTISIRRPGDSMDQAILDYDFSAGSDNTLYTYGPSVDLSEILVIGNLALADYQQASQVRFVNVTPDSSIQFDLGLAKGGEQIIIPTPAQQGEGTADIIPFRERLFTGVFKVAVDTRGGAASMPMFTESGRTDFYVIDTARDLVASKLMDYALEPGVHYDIVAYQIPDSLEVRTLVLPYNQDVQP